jgi:hypothetical protein
VRSGLPPLLVPSLVQGRGGPHPRSLGADEGAVVSVWCLESQVHQAIVLLGGNTWRSWFLIRSTVPLFTSLSFSGLSAVACFVFMHLHSDLYLLI